MSVIKKIVITGPESTGKSTLSNMLSQSLQTVWVPEYAREYLEGINRPYVEEDLLAIATGQIAAETALLQKANQYLVCDTDLYVLKVWSEHKYRRCHRSILEDIATLPCHLYLLTDIDMPWEEDPMREHPQEDMRRYFFNVYKDIVINSNVPWAQVSGDPEQRLQQALAAIKRIT